MNVDYEQQFNGNSALLKEETHAQHCKPGQKPMASKLRNIIIIIILLLLLLLLFGHRIRKPFKDLHLYP